MRRERERKKIMSVIKTHLELAISANGNIKKKYGWNIKNVMMTLYKKAQALFAFVHLRRLYTYIALKCERIFSYAPQLHRKKAIINLFFSSLLFFPIKV
jgi:hypothetical protein